MIMIQFIFNIVIMSKIKEEYQAILNLINQSEVEEIQQQHRRKLLSRQLFSRRSSSIFPNTNSKKKKFLTFYRQSSCSGHPPESPRQGNNIFLRNFNQQIKTGSKGQPKKTSINFNSKNTSMIIRRLYHKKDEDNKEQKGPSSVSAGSPVSGRSHKVMSNRIKETNKKNISGKKYLSIVNPQVVGQKIHYHPKKLHKT